MGLPNDNETSFNFNRFVIFENTEQKIFENKKSKIFDEAGNSLHIKCDLVVSIVMKPIQDFLECFTRPRKTGKLIKEILLSFV